MNYREEAKRVENAGFRIVESARQTRGLSDQQFAERAESLYHNTSFRERPCDHCGASYQGPAVFCSLKCAVAAA